MSALYGYLSGDRGTVTKASTREIAAKVQNSEDALALTLWADGGFSLYREAGPHGSGPRVCIVSGNVNHLERVASDCEVA